MRRATLISACLLLALGIAEAGVEERYRFARSLEVPEAGWVRVPLDGRAVSGGFPDDRWKLADPAGREIPHRVLAPRRGFVTARTHSAERTDEGWAIVFDLGPVPIRHSRLDVELVRPTSASEVLLEGSDDLVSWSVLTSGALFRLGTEATLRRSALHYPVTDLRYLRLTWPESAGFPEFAKYGGRLFELHIYG